MNQRDADRIIQKTHEANRRIAERHGTKEEADQSHGDALRAALDAYDRENPPPVKCGVCGSGGHTTDGHPRSDYDDNDRHRSHVHIGW